MPRWTDYSDQECSAVSRAEAAQHLNHTAALLSASLRCAADVTARTNREGGADSYYHTLNFFHELSGVIVVLYMTYMHQVRYHSKCAAASNAARTHRDAAHRRILRPSTLDGLGPAGAIAACGSVAAQP